MSVSLAVCVCVFFSSQRRRRHMRRFTKKNKPELLLLSPAVIASAPPVLSYLCEPAMRTHNRGPKQYLKATHRPAVKNGSFV